MINQELTNPTQLDKSIGLHYLPDGSSDGLSTNLTYDDIETEFVDSGPLFEKRERVIVSGPDEDLDLLSLNSSAQSRYHVIRPKNVQNDSNFVYNYEYKDYEQLTRSTRS